MEKETILAESEQKNLTEAIVIFNVIDSYYKKLANLEKQGKKGKNEYIVTASLLKNIIEKEQISIDKIRSSINLIRYISKANIKLANSGTKEDETNTFFTRMHNKLSLDEMKDYFEISKKLLSKMLSKLDHDLDEKVLEGVCEKNIEISSKFDHDIIGLSMIFFEEEIKKEKDEKIRDSLIEYKYKIILREKVLEDEFIDSSFTIEPNFSLVIPSFLKDSDIESKILAEINRKIKYSNLTKKLVSTILDKDKIKEVGEEKYLQCLLRAQLLNLEEEDIAELNYYFHEETENNKNSDYDSATIKDITNIFKGLKKDKETYLKYTGETGNTLKKDL